MMRPKAEEKAGEGGEVCEEGWSGGGDNKVCTGDDCVYNLIYFKYEHISNNSGGRGDDHPGGRGDDKFEMLQSDWLG